MTFTPLETMAVTAFFSACTAIAVRLLFSGSFMTRRDCSAEREKLCIERKQVRDDLDSIKNGQRTLFRMQRAMIVYSDIPDDKKEEVLNGD